MTYDKVVLVTRETRLEGLIERFNTRSQTKFYVTQSGGNFSLFEQEHETYHRAVNMLKHLIREKYKLQVVQRSFLPNFVFSPQDVIVTIGIDGLVVNTAKYLAGQPLIAVNPDPAHIDGILLPFQVSEALSAIEKVFEGTQKYKQITMAQVTLNDGQTLRAFNDLFIGAASHISARYQLELQGKSEAHSSSGIIVSTGAGSTGWISSVVNMTNGVIRKFQPKGNSIKVPKLDWNAESLLFAVREPFASKTSSANIVSGYITKQQPLIIESQMEQHGVIFSDGMESDFLSFNAGTKAIITLAEQKTNLVVG